MRLADLEPHWITEVQPGGCHRKDRVYRDGAVQGILFLCPLCFAANSGPIGTHSVLVPFKDRGVPDDAYPGMARWTAEGRTFDDLTVTPSILIKGGCGWHGFVTAGEAITV